MMSPPISRTVQEIVEALKGSSGRLEDFPEAAIDTWISVGRQR